ncbi:MAG: phosphate ABC transporter permease subunit PstC [Actinomycetes bacterium]
MTHLDRGTRPVASRTAGPTVDSLADPAAEQLGVRRSDRVAEPDGGRGGHRQAGNGRTRKRRGDGIFRGVSATASAVVLLLMGAIAAFLVVKAIPAIRADDTNFLTTQDWLPDNAGPDGKNVFGIAALLFHTVATSVVAMVLAVPVAVGTALFLTHYAPRRIAAPLGYLVDLLAAVPSIVYGLWGFAFLAPHLTGLVLWLDRWLGWIPVFNYRPDNIPNNRSDLTAGIVLAIMILPIISSISREIFRQVPRDNVEAALALGATRWEMVRTSVLPYGRSGVLSASILGLGRALGETLAVTLILASAYSINIHLTENGGVTFASNIANKYGEAGAVGTGALIASGLCLFLITLLVNFGGNLLIRRGTKGA